ncbi:methyltransferase domain-containing protein [Rhodobacterales bacterium HKCCSP123]|nr:methyltransferase domain-containing protein [Rhodobacterales bacterium HKCCSP123]
MSADLQTLGVYATEAARYAGLAPTRREEVSLSAFLARLPVGARILDLGCGPGHQALRMQAAGCRVTAWDACPEFVAAARGKGLPAEERSFDDLDAVAGFDGVWASFSLLHAPRIDLPRHLAAIARALVPGGWLFLGMKLGEGEGRDGLGRFYTYVSAAELGNLVRAAGFTPVETVEDKARGLAGTVDPFILMTCRQDA